MPATRPTTIQQRQKIMQLAQTGHSHATIAQDVGVSVWTARKWVRRTRAGDLMALVSHLGRPVTGTLAASSPLVRYVALRLKRQHPTWGQRISFRKCRPIPGYTHNRSRTRCLSGGIGDCSATACLRLGKPPSPSRRRLGSSMASGNSTSKNPSRCPASVPRRLLRRATASAVRPCCIKFIPRRLRNNTSLS